MAIVETGGQSAAARHLRRSLQSIARSLVALERERGRRAGAAERRGARSATEAGLAFFRRVKPAVAEIEDARNRSRRVRRAEPSGLLSDRRSRSQFAAAHRGAGRSRSSCERYPACRGGAQGRPTSLSIVFEREARPRRADPRPARFEPSKARRLGRAAHRSSYGTPGLLRARTAVRSHPDDLARPSMRRARCSRPDDDRNLARSASAGRLKSRPRRRAFVPHRQHAASDPRRGGRDGTRPRLRTPFWQIRDLVDQGVVEVVLEEFEPARLPIHAVWPATKLPTPKVRLFADALAQRLKNENL